MCFFPFCYMFSGCFCCCSVHKSCPILCDPMNCSMPGSPVLHYLPEFAQTSPKSIELVMPFSHLILCHPLLLLPSIFLSIRIFSSESVLCIRWPQYSSFSFSLSPSNERSGLTSFWIDLVGSPCSPRDTEESSPAPHFTSLNGA